MFIIRGYTSNGIDTNFDNLAITSFPSKASSDPGHGPDEPVPHMGSSLHFEGGISKPSIHRLILEIFILDNKRPQARAIQYKPKTFGSKCQAEPLQVFDVPAPKSIRFRDGRPISKMMSPFTMRASP